MEEKKKLVEYWPERREWADPETGKVLGKATSAEAEVLARMLAHEDVADAGDGVKRVTTAALLALDGQSPGGAAAQVLVSGHVDASTAGDISREIPETSATLVPSNSADAASAYWLWVDPRREANYRPATFDHRCGSGTPQAAFLARAVALFRSKDRWGGQLPAVVVANPAQTENGLQPVARALGLAAVSDPTVAAGTYRLGLQMTMSSSKVTETKGGGNS